jgi:hypothetical protein
MDACEKFRDGDYADERFPVGSPFAEIDGLLTLALTLV